MATFVVPFRQGGKTRLGDPLLARAMLDDVLSACTAVGATVVADAPGGQGRAVASALAQLAGTGPIAIVNSDLPCAQPHELEQLLAAAPALVAALDGTTNALSLTDADDFEPLYGPGSASRFQAALGARLLDLPGLRDDVDTREDLERILHRAGEHTRRALEVRV
jgi:2-phospho-L-lactate guanylyltransferase (CobY/MobA/RfbA family)